MKTIDYGCNRGILYVDYVFYVKKTEEEMLNFVSFKESFAELKTAVCGVVRDAWKTNPRQLILVVSLSAVTGLVPYAVNGVLALLLNQLVTDTRTSILSTILILLALGYAGALLFRDAVPTYLQYVSKVAWIDRRQRYELQLSEKLASLDIATHENKGFRDEVQTLEEQGSSFAVANFLDSIIRNGQNIAGVAMASTIVILIDWRLFATIWVASLPALYTELRYGHGMWSIFQSKSSERRHYMEAREHTRSRSGIREMQTYQTVTYFIGRQSELLARFLSSIKGEERRRFLFVLVSQVLVAGAILIVLFVLTRQVIAGTLQVGTFVFTLTTAIGLEATLTAFLTALADQRSDARAVAAYYGILARERVVKNPVKGVQLAIVKAPRIEFRDVSFTYPACPGEMVLRNLSLTIQPGERLALVGANSVGKSTLIKLLCRFYDPTSGAILIDGIDLRDLDLESWYRHLALLSQEYENYHLKVWELIRLGRYGEERNQPRIEQAAERSQADIIIEGWKDRYDEQLGPEFGGADPSGGQWQKLALARALYRNASVTILDEPTAHIDAAAEQQIFEHLETQFKRTQTLILISHRFSTVRRADRICVLKDGAVVELGSHLELVTQNGIYAGLFDKQAKGYQ